MARGHGSKTRKREQFLSALLSLPTIHQAAAAAGISDATARRWLKEEAFAAQYAEARRQALDEVIATLQQGMLLSVATLRHLMAAPTSPLWLRAQCARDVLALGFKAWDVYDTQNRLAALEGMVRQYAEQERKTAR